MFACDPRCLLVQTFYGDLQHIAHVRKSGTLSDIHASSEFASAQAKRQLYPL